MFTQPLAVIGMIHVEALPGTPRYRGPLADILAKARWEAAVYAEAGVDALMIENMHDLPYLPREVGPEITAAMTLVAHEVKKTAPLPCGVQILAGANQAALAVALAAELDFIRAEGFVFGHMADEGLLEADAGALLRYRRNIGAGHIKIFADIKKKHAAHALTSDVSLAHTAEAASFFGADGVVVTGTATGKSASPSDVAEVKESVALPVLVGSGVNTHNLLQFKDKADALIVGSAFKQDGVWSKPVEANRVKRFMEAVHSLREN